jgi:hypothetical protein
MSKAGFASAPIRHNYSANLAAPVKLVPPDALPKTVNSNAL